MADFDETITSDNEHGVGTESRENGSIQTSDTTTEISQNPKENTRRLIAGLYVCAFFAIIYICLIIGVVNNYSVNDYKDILIAVSGVLSGPLGFIVGYYFKASTE